jgi:hypothetical protein
MRKIYLLPFFLLIACKGETQGVSDNNVGVSKEYFSNGKLKTEETFVGKSKNGYSKSYYETGEIESKIYFKDGYKHGEGWYYYKNGKIESYLFFWEGKLLYKRYYDEAENFVKDEGEGIIYSKINKPDFSINDTLIDSLTVVNPNNSKVEFFLTDVGINDSLYNFSQIPLLSKNLVIHKVKLKEKGIFKCGYSLKITDVNTGKITEYFYGIKVPIAG